MNIRTIDLLPNKLEFSGDLTEETTVEINEEQLKERSSEKPVTVKHRERRPSKKPHTKKKRFTTNTAPTSHRERRVNVKAIAKRKINLIEADSDGSAETKSQTPRKGKKRINVFSLKKQSCKD